MWTTDIKMQINAYNNLLSSQPAGANPPARADKKDLAEESGGVAAFSTDVERLIKQVKVESDDHRAVEQARQALAEGRLESKEAFLSAAETIIRLGI
ncbi:MAG: hypothetical protein GX298_05405 [Planctomycetes bacterium]|jgi:hypothetical protein|nr:hypothetical protein [Planctomycetota bacterium]